MMDYINITPLVDPIINWTNVAPFEPKRPIREPLITQTGLAQSKPFDLFATGTGARTPTAVPDVRTVSESPCVSAISEFSCKASPYSIEGAPDADIDRIANQRVRLMAAKYVSGAASTEVVARLEILNQKLLDRAPRVSIDQLESLESANEKLARIRAAREERSKRLGLSA